MGDYYDGGDIVGHVCPLHHANEPQWVLECPATWPHAEVEAVMAEHMASDHGLTAGVRQ